MFARISVIWTAAALGSTLGDILPRESKGQDLATMIADRGAGGNAASEASSIDTTRHE